ncbi:MAG: hypothetical protein KGI97_05285 [Alphaproteobacteria bacterium]|nr:hypothetical protein [Alphaproteobacteria bacterium]
MVGRAFIKNNENHYLHFITPAQKLDREKKRSLLSPEEARELDLKMLDAARQGQKTLLEPIFEEGADPNARDERGFPALMVLSTFGCACVLLENYADPMLEATLPHTENKIVPFLYHITEGNLGVARLIKGCMTPQVLDAMREAAVEAGKHASFCGFRQTAQWIESNFGHNGNGGIHIG